MRFSSPFHGGENSGNCLPTGLSAYALASIAAINASVKAGTSSGLRLVMVLASGTGFPFNHIGTGVLEVGADRRPAGCAPAAQQIRFDQQPWPMADRRYRLIGI